MINVKLPDGSTAQFPDGTPPAVIKAAIQKKFPPKQAPAAAPQAAPVGAAPAQPAAPPAPRVPVPADSLNTDGLAMPTGGAPINSGQPNRSFGFTSADTLNPVPAIVAAGDQMAAHIPIVGPALQNWRDGVNAWANGTTPQAARADANADVAANPVPAAAGAMTGSTLPYAVASLIPGVGEALGMSGPLMSRLAMTPLSQYAINTGDNLAHGQDPVTAARNAVVPTALSVPFALLGKGPEAVGTHADAVATLKAAGVPLTGGQVRGSPGLQKAESELGGAAAQAFHEKQTQAYTKAVMSTGVGRTTLADPDNLKAAYDDIGGKMTALASITPVKVDAKLQNDLLDTVTNYQQLTGTPAPVLENMMNRVATMAQQNGTLSGAQYEKLITDIRTAQEGTGDTGVKIALGKFRDAIDDAVERSTNGQTRAAWQKLRTQYRNLSNIMTAVSGPGSDAAKGLVTPTALRTALAGDSRKGYATGKGDLNDLARAGVQVLPKVADSGTAGRSWARYVASGAIPAAADAASAGRPLEAVGSAAGLALPWLAGRAAISPAGRAFLGGPGSKIPSVLARGNLPRLTGSQPWLTLPAPPSGQ